jgi:hypothetical protein
MAPIKKNTNLSKGINSKPVFRPDGILSQRFSFYKPDFSTVSNISVGLIKDVNPTINATTDTTISSPSTLPDIIIESNTNIVDPVVIPCSDTPTPTPTPTNTPTNTPTPTVL